MTENQKKNDVTDLFTDEWTVEWMEEHLSELKQSVAGPRILYQSLGVGFVVGLSAHIGGYVLLLSGSGEPLGLLANLLQALGLSLWTGVVVAVFVQVVPEAKRRQIKQALDAYDALRRDPAQVSSQRVAAKRKQDQKSNRERTRKNR